MPLFVGCYSYTPIEVATVPTGSEVRARITGAASDRVAPLLGTFDTRVLIGNVVENNAGTMVLEVPTGAMPNVVASVVPLHARIPLAAADMVSLEQRKLDVSRTSISRGCDRGGNRHRCSRRNSRRRRQFGRRPTAGRSAADQSNSDLSASLLGRFGHGDLHGALRLRRSVVALQQRSRPSHLVRRSRDSDDAEWRVRPNADAGAGLKLRT